MHTPKPSKGLQFLKDTSVDENMVEKLLKAARIVATTAYGESDWARPLRLDVELEDGAERKYFLKIASGNTGRSLFQGEFESTSIYHAISPDFAIKPLAWGSCASEPDTYFILSDFHDMGDEAPEFKTFCAKTAELHAKSAEIHQLTIRKPIQKGNYGFHMTTHVGILPQDNRWCDTWEEFYIQGMKHILAIEEKTQGHSDELALLAIQLIEKVIPRLLRPIETGGRRIKPTLAHGDLQIGNARTDLTTKKAVVFDAGSFGRITSADDIGKWRLERFQFGPRYIEEYHKYIPKSAPEGDWEDRNILYSTYAVFFIPLYMLGCYMKNVSRFNLISSAHFAGDTRMRSMALEDMRYLVNKFPDGCNGFE